MDFHGFAAASVESVSVDSGGESFSIFFGRCFECNFFKSGFTSSLSAESAELGINLQIFNKSADFSSQKVIFSTEIAKRACRVVYRRGHLRKLQGRAQNTSASKS